MSVDEFADSPIDGREQRLLVQEFRETCERARLGGFFYPMAVALGFLVTSRQYLIQAIVLTACFALLAALRLVIRAPEAPDKRQVQTHLRRLWSVILVTNVLWGAFSAWSFMVLPEPAPLVSLLFSSAFGMALAHSLCMRRLPCVVGILAVMSPSLVMLWRGITPGVGLMWAIYLTYMLLVLLRSHREYRTRLELEVDLREQRDKFEIQSRIDDLTGIFNRRTFADALASSLEGAARDMPVSLMILDIDYFKRINDTHGHLAGDSCLVAFAQRLKQHFSRSGDVVGRLGGEEFGVIVRCDLEGARQRAEQFRLDLGSSTPMFEGDETPIAVSIGCGSFDARHHVASDALYREVDAALYKAKTSGRNRTECAELDAIRAQPAGIAPAG
ncbi:MAG: GGDEF domain-containing protein [Dokdonella sp.]